MTDGIKRFMELLNTDEAFREKLKTRLESFDGEKTEEAFFNEVLLPLGQEYGISATYEDFRDLLASDREMTMKEIEQIAGGKTGGVGGTFCFGLGLGLGGGGGEGTGGGCAIIGGGWGTYNCYGNGKSNTYS